MLDENFLKETQREFPTSMGPVQLPILCEKANVIQGFFFVI